MTIRNEHDTLPPSMEPSASAGIVVPPTTIGGIIRRIGPGLIIAGSIVGSGELIATTKTGAQAGIALLWLIIVGCLIKVFVQIELGRFAITHGETTLSALDQVPGPRLRANWILWLWVVMALCTIGQLGGIVGGVGQALAITFPFTGDYQSAIRVPAEADFRRLVKWEADRANGSPEFNKLSEREQKRMTRGLEILESEIHAAPRGDAILKMVREGRKKEELIDPETKVSLVEPPTYDDKYWAAGVTVLTSALLFVGRYGLIQNLSIALVVCFTFITLGNVVSLQGTTQWHIPLSEFLRGLSFAAPEVTGGKNPWLTALATFGIIGVGASELIAYPYWCLEKGYAKFTGIRTQEQSWADRARGWMRVMHVDAYASMAVYTVATLAFYIMGVAVLHNEGRDPDGMRMVSTLAAAYVPVFGEFAKWLFLIGAIAVLYSTFLVANAGNARMVTDALKVFRLIDPDRESTHQKSVTVLSVLLPFLCLAVFCSGANPVRVILIAGVMQAFMLPVLGFSSIYFRYTMTDPRLAPSRAWDTALIVSCLGLLVAGGYGVYVQALDLAAKM